MVLIRETLVYPPRIYPLYPVPHSYLTYILGSSENVVVMALTQKQSRFGFEYCKDYNGTKAAIRAGYSENGADVSASRLLALDSVQERIKEREEELACVFEIDSAWVLKQWRDIALADPRALTKVVVRPCRLCWPDGLQIEDPNPLCIAPILMKDGGNMGGCGGAGETAVILQDSSKLRGPALRLFAGAKQTKNGIEIKLRDQDAALANISNYLGMNVKRTEVSGPGGGPLNIATVNLNELTDEQLVALCVGDEPGANALREGSIEGTLSLASSNPSRVNDLEPGSTP